MKYATLLAASSSSAMVVCIYRLFQPTSLTCMQNMYLQTYKMCSLKEILDILPVWEVIF